MMSDEKLHLVIYGDAELYQVMGSEEEWWRWQIVVTVIAGNNWW